MVAFYKMKCNDVVTAVFTTYARYKIYFRDEANNRLYYHVNENKVYMPFIYNKELFVKCERCLYPIGTEIVDAENKNVYGKILYYEIDVNLYIVRRGNITNKIPFDKAQAKIPYYFVSSSGKVQTDYVGRDESAENFRKKTNNYFIVKDDAMKKLQEMFM